MGSLFPLEAKQIVKRLFTQFFCNLISNLTLSLSLPWQGCGGGWTRGNITTAAGPATWPGQAGGQDHLQAGRGEREQLLHLGGGGAESSWVGGG